MGLGKVLLEPDGLAVLRDGLLQLALALQSRFAEVVVGLGVIRIESRWPRGSSAMASSTLPLAESGLRRG